MEFSNTNRLGLHNIIFFINLTNVITLIINFIKPSNRGILNKNFIFLIINNFQIWLIILFNSVIKNINSSYLYYCLIFSFEYCSK